MYYIYIIVLMSLRVFAKVTNRSRHVSVRPSWQQCRMLCRAQCMPRLDSQAQNKVKVLPQHKNPNFTPYSVKMK